VQLSVQGALTLACVQRMSADLCCPFVCMVVKLKMYVCEREERRRCRIKKSGVSNSSRVVKKETETKERREE
jgi:hypothetical protein